jgi:hypothetical protein
MRTRWNVLAAGLALLTAGHADAAPIDHEGRISDVYAFQSYDGGAIPRVTLILCADPQQDPSEGPGWRPFDPELLYELKIDNNNDAVEDIVFQFRFGTEQRLPNVSPAYLGVGAAGSTAPANSPAPVPPGTLIIPPQITSFSSPGLGQRQSYTVTMIKGGVATPITGVGPFFAVPPNVGPRTMNYAALFAAAIQTTNQVNVRVFAGNVDDPAWAERGGFFDTLNSSKAPPVLSAAEDAALVNLASDSLSGFAVNAIAIEVPVSMITRTGQIEPASSTAATIGVWASTSRPRSTLRRAPLPPQTSGSWSQVDRRGHPLTSELLIGTGFKLRFALDQPKNDAQFASFFLDPALARFFNAVTGGAIAIPTPPRLDLLPLVSYAPPIAAAGTPAGPVADLLRLNTGVPPTPPASASLSRLGLLGGDPAGYPNGRRVFDDGFDVALRLVAGGILAGPPFSTSAINTRLGDGVNVNDAVFPTAFPYLAGAPSGRSRRHIDPAEAGCTAGAGAPCLP